ncbi:MAG: hypothetical protein SynsKO_35350 [Synoicihabitans sp.]
MKLSEILRIAVIALVAGSAAFLITRQLSPTDQSGDEITWLIEEFGLNADQADRVRELHAAYRPICDAHCTEIMEAQAALENATAAERPAAERALAALKQRCHTATQTHIKAVAAVMPAEQGQRYIERIMPLLSAHAHDEPFGLR